MKKITELFLFQLKIHAKSMITWSIVLFSIMSLYMFFFSTMQEMAQIKFKMLPKELMQFMGIEDLSQMSNYVTYFGMIFHILIIILSIYAITTAIQLIRKEEENKTIEFLYALAVTRKQIYLSKLLVGFFSVCMVIVSIAFAGIVFGYLVGDETFDLVNLFSIIKITGTIPFFFLAIGFFLAATNSRYSSIGLGCGIVMLSYLLGYLGEILKDQSQFLCYFSPFQLLSPTNALAFNNETFIAFCMISLLILILFTASAFTYSSRDYHL